MSPKKNNRPFTHNHEKSGLTKLPKRPSYPVPVTKTPEEVAQEIEGLRMHMADKAKELENLADSSIKPNGLFDYLKDEDQENTKVTYNLGRLYVYDAPPSKPNLRLASSKEISKNMEKLVNSNIPLPDEPLRPCSSKLALLNNKLVLLDIKIDDFINTFESLKEKNEWLDEKEKLQCRINELEAFCYSETQEKQKLYSENLGLNAENFTLSTTADELSEALEKNRYLEETLQKRNDFIKSLQDEQYQLGNTIETLNLKLDKKDEYLKHIDSQRMDAINRAFNSSESFARSSEKVIAQQQIIKNLQDEKFEVEVDLEESKESYDNLNKKYEKLQIDFTVLKNYSSEQSDKIYELDRDLKFQKYNYDMTSKLLKEIHAENTELREERKNLKSVLNVKTSSLNVKNAYIEELEKRLIYYVFKNDNLFLSIFNASKANGTLYFSIWLVIWVVCLFTVFNFIG